MLKEEREQGDLFEDTEVIEIPSELSASTRAQYADVLQDKEALEQRKKQIIAKLEDMEALDSMTETGVYVGLGTETFRSQIGSNHEDVQIPKDHPLMPVLEYAKELIDKHKDFNSDVDLGSILIRAEETEIPIEIALNKIFLPLYKGKGEFPTELSPELREILGALALPSKDPYAVKEKDKFIKAASHLIHSFGNEFNREGLQKILDQFTDEVTS